MAPADDNDVKSHGRPCVSRETSRHWVRTSPEAPRSSLEGRSSGRRKDALRSRCFWIILLARLRRSLRHEAFDISQAPPRADHLLPYTQSCKNLSEHVFNP